MYANGLRFFIEFSGCGWLFEEEVGGFHCVALD
jgi:hypothetical protein